DVLFTVEVSSATTKVATPGRVRRAVTRSVSPQIGEAVPMATAAVFGTGDIGSAVLRRLAGCEWIERLCAFVAVEQWAPRAIVDAAAVASHSKTPPVTEWDVVGMRDPVRLAVTR